MKGEKMVNRIYIEIASQVVNEIERRKKVPFPTDIKMQMTTRIAHDMAKYNVEDVIVKGNGEPLTINVGTINIL